MKALGIEGDTPRDTVATLVAQVKQLRTELQTALTDNRTHKSENERMRARENAIDQRIENALDGERDRLRQEREETAGTRQQTEGVLQDLQRRLDTLSGKGDVPAGLGLEDGDGAQFEGLRWIEPGDAPSAKSTGAGKDGKGFSFPTSFGPAQERVERAAASATLGAGLQEAVDDQRQRAADQGFEHVVVAVEGNAGDRGEQVRHDLGVAGRKVLQRVGLDHMRQCEEAQRPALLCVRAPLEKVAPDPVFGEPGAKRSEVGRPFIARLIGDDDVAQWLVQLAAQAGDEGRLAPARLEVPPFADRGAAGEDGVPGGGLPGDGERGGAAGSPRGRSATGWCGSLTVPSTGTRPISAVIAIDPIKVAFAGTV